MISTNRGGPWLGKSRSRPLQARLLPEPDHLDEDVGAGGLVHCPVVGNPDPLAAQLDDLGGLAQLPGRGDLAEPFDEGRDLGRDVKSRVELMGDEPRAGVKMKAPRLAARAPAQLGVQPEIVAMQEGRQEERHLQAVSGRRAEEAQGSVDLDRVTVGHRPLHAVYQAVELEPAEKLAITRWALVLDLHLDPDRSREHRLRQRDVVPIDEPLGRQVFKFDHPVLVPEVGEEAGEQDIGVEVQLLAHRAQHFISDSKNGSFLTWGWSFEGALGNKDTSHIWMYNTPTPVHLPSQI